MNKSKIILICLSLFSLFLLNSILAEANPISLQDGDWPKRFGGYVEPLICDIDGDGENLEIILNEYRRIKIYNSILNELLEFSGSHSGKGNDFCQL